MFPWRWFLPMTLAVLVVTTPAAASGQVYKWVDEEGVTHYSQQPPPKGERTIIATPTAPSSAESGPSDAGNKNTDDKDASDHNEDSESNTETIAQFCKNMRKREKLLASDRSVRLKNDDGTLTPLTGDDRAQRLKQVRNQLEQNCQDSDQD